MNKIFVCLLRGCFLSKSHSLKIQGPLYIQRNSDYNSITENTKRTQHDIKKLSVFNYIFNWS